MEVCHYRWAFEDCTFSLLCFWSDTLMWGAPVACSHLTELPYHTFPAMMDCDCLKPHVKLSFSTHKLFLVYIWLQQHWGNTESSTRSGVISVIKHDHLVLKPLKLVYGRNVEKVEERAIRNLDYYKQSLLEEDPDASRNEADKHCTQEVSDENHSEVSDDNSTGS